METLPTKNKDGEYSIPLISVVKDPFSSSTLDLHFKDPKNNKHGTVTLITEFRERAEKHQLNKSIIESNKQLTEENFVEAREMGVNKDELSKEQKEDSPYYVGYTIVLPGETIRETIAQWALERLAEEYGENFRYEEIENKAEVNPFDKLPEIKRDCEICGETRHESDMNLVPEDKHLTNSKHVCEGECTAAAKL